MEPFSSGWAKVYEEEEGEEEEEEEVEGASDLFGRVERRLEVVGKEAVEEEEGDVYEVFTSSRETTAFNPLTQ